MYSVAIKEIINATKNELLEKAKRMEKVSSDFKELDKPINNYVQRIDNSETKEKSGKPITQAETQKKKEVKDRSFLYLGVNINLVQCSQKCKIAD